MGWFYFFYDKDGRLITSWTDRINWKQKRRTGR